MICRKLEWERKTPLLNHINVIFLLFSKNQGVQRQIGLFHNVSMFYGRQSAISPWLSAFLILANSLTVLQIYRQAFSIPQLTHLNHFYLILIPETFLSSPKHLYLILIPGTLLSSPKHLSYSDISLCYPHSKKGFSKIWTHNLLFSNTCLNQLSYWNRQEKYTFF